MKTSFRFTFLILITAFVIGACSSSVGFSKRKYTKGYYVSKIKDQHGFPNKNAAIHKPITRIANSSTEDLTKPTPPPNEQLGAIPIYQKKPFENMRKLIPANFSKNLNLHRLQPTSLFALAKNSKSENPAGFMASNPENKKLLGTSNDDKSYSLLWIAVVVIVFLWYLGFLAGWGSSGIINLLLILAFILLVLWLLRIL
jgi:hypothetical protein